MSRQLVVAIILSWMCASAYACMDDLDCNDGNPCTNDTCDDGYIDNRCVYTYLDVPCNDGDPCTCNDRCHTGQCYGDRIVNADCKLPGKYCVDSWLFVLLTACCLIAVLMLIFMLCLRFIAPPPVPYGGAYGMDYSQQQW